MIKLPPCRIAVFYLLPPLLAFLAFTSVNFKTDLSAFIIAGDNAEELLLANEMQSGSLSRRYLISIGSDSGQNVPREFGNQLQSELKKIAGVNDVWSPDRQQDFSQTLQTLYSRYANAFYSLGAEPVLAEIFTENGLKRRAEFLKKALLSPQGTAIRGIAVRDPLLLTLTGFRSTGEQMQKTGPPDSRYRNLILETSMAGFNVAEQSRIQAAIQSAFDRINHNGLHRLKLDMTGVPVFAVATQQLIQGDIARVSIISSIGQLLLYLLIFRSIGSLFKVFTLLTIVLLTSLLATQAAFGYVHGMTVAIGSTLIGICIDFPIHAMVHAQAAAVNKRTEIIARLWPSMLLGGFTTMIGYAALGASGYPGFQQVAVYAVAGIATALLLTRFVLPGLMTANRTQTLLVPWVSQWQDFCLRHRFWLAALLLLLTMPALLGIKSLQWMQDMQDLTPELDYLKENDKRIRSRMVSIEPGRFILIAGNTMEDALQETERVYALLEELKRQGALTDYFGLYPWLLSEQLQHKNQLALKRHLTADNLLLWQTALKEQGLSVKHLGHFDYSDSTTLAPTQVMASPIKKLIDSRIVTDGKQTMVIIWLAEHSPKALQAAFDGLPGVHYFSQRDVLNRMTQEYTDKAKASFSVGLGLILLILTIRYRSILKTLQTLFPSILASLLILGAWSLSGTAVSFLHLVGFLLVISICDDYGIFYQENRGENLSLTYQSMAASMLTSLLAFGCLGAAESASLRILAGVVALGVLLGFLFCPLMIGFKQYKKPNKP